MKLTVTQLRQNIYRVLDEVIATGAPVEIERNGHVLRIVPADSASWLDELPRREVIVGDPDEIVHLDWSTEWKA